MTMRNLIQRGVEIARVRQKRSARMVAERLGAMLGSAAVQVEDTRVLVSGRGLIRRWLSEPGLRFFGGALK